MGVYIKGMEMPKSCLSCPLQGGTADCRITQKTYNWGLSERPSDCPLVPVPPHRRLIEAEPIMKYITDGLNSADLGYDAIKVMTEIEYAPTIIPAEDGEP